LPTDESHLSIKTLHAIESGVTGLRWIATSAFASLSACGAHSIVDHLAGVAVRLALFVSVQIVSIVKSTPPRVVICGAVLVYATAAFAQSNSTELLPRGESMVMGDNTEPNKPPSDCATRFAEFVRDLDGILASAPRAIDPIYAAFQRFFPMQKCSVEEILTIARKSRFFVGSEESPAFYSMAFDSAGTGPGNGFALLISLNKKTGNLEKSFAKVNGF
jgi:hypothetical protein